MDQKRLEIVLADLPLGAIRFLETTSSTNDEASRWAQAGAPDLSLVVADEQTAGRGRGARRWFTPPGSALAFSLVLRPLAAGSAGLPNPARMARLTALGALAVCDALSEEYRLPVQIKWPNDVLLRGRKVAGVLVETEWRGDQWTAAILGIGVNITEAAVPLGETLTFPATSIEAASGNPIDRVELLHAVLRHLLHRRQSLDRPDFLQSWEKALAFRGQEVRIQQGNQVLHSGRLAGLMADGSLRLITAGGDTVAINFGEVQLRPVDRPPE
jgi:BirA family biotin operon repressor/biotin-[acetyl-CoA-carboxylase] ligase